MLGKPADKFALRQLHAGFSELPLSLPGTQTQ
jgi:hypothetical protein